MMGPARLAGFFVVPRLVVVNSVRPGVVWDGGKGKEGECKLMVKCFWLLALDWPRIS